MNFPDASEIVPLNQAVHGYQHTGKVALNENLDNCASYAAF
jgi:hypothetical protein